MMVGVGEGMTVEEVLHNQHFSKTIMVLVTYVTDASVDVAADVELAASVGIEVELAVSVGVPMVVEFELGSVEVAVEFAGSSLVEVEVEFEGSSVAEVEVEFEGISVVEVLEGATVGVVSGTGSVDVVDVVVEVVLSGTAASTSCQAVNRFPDPQNSLAFP
jgi:hypothetical protein